LEGDDLSPPALTPQRLYHACDPAQFGFQSTAELEGLTER
jgi:hypothetical protein